MPCTVYCLTSAPVDRRHSSLIAQSKRRVERCDKLHNLKGVVPRKRHKTRYCTGWMEAVQGSSATILSLFSYRTFFLDITTTFKFNKPDEFHSLLGDFCSKIDSSCRTSYMHTDAKGISWDTYHDMRECVNDPGQMSSPLFHLFCLFRHCQILVKGFDRLDPFLFLCGMSTTQIYDDTNAAFIYQPADAWTAGNWNASSVDQSGTLHVTNNLAANITFTFPVPASGFSYFGIQRSRGGLYGICIDCTPGAPNFISVDAFNASDNGANPPVLLFQRNFSTLGVHQIIIQNMADPRGTPAGNSQITIDRIELIVPGEGGGTTTVTAPSNPTNTGSSPTTSETSATHKSTPIGAIVGGVLGALALVVGAIILFFWLRLRRKRAYDPARQAALSPSVSQFQPDPFFSSNSETMGASPNSAPSPPLTSQSPWGGYGTGLSTGTTVSEKSAAAERNYHQRMMPSVTSVATSVQPPSSASVSGSGSGPPSAVGPSRSSGPRREQDAGPLPAPLDDEEEEEDTLPPEYGQVFARRSTRRSRRTTAPLPDVPPSPPVAEKRPYPHVLSTVNDSEEGS